MVVMVMMMMVQCPKKQAANSVLWLRWTVFFRVLADPRLREDFMTFASNGLQASLSWPLDA